ncbi:MAG: filamentous hemagglutinin N-terminal domain-containing protein, partial [Cyanothece sp. SIO1E1]|nr:filamentous hemagglutinin N-terminal domain-containing protein [Cyanothece sp. SIO1E1]
MVKYLYFLWIAKSFFLYHLIAPNLSFAQVISDTSVLTNVITPDNLNFNITGGIQVGDNLFQSFSEFSIPEGGTASFENSPNVQNIISRVTGNSMSAIDGLIQTQGSTSLFLINPNGIVFGPQAKLAIGGSFLASTADSLQFMDGSVFSATEPEVQPLLTMSVPIGLQFGEMPGAIVNRSQATVDFMGSEVSVGLQVESDQTLALVGGDVSVEGGILSSLGGNVEIGSVAGSSLVSLMPVSEGLALGFEDVQSFQDIQLSQAIIDTSSLETSGAIRLRGRQITIADGSDLFSLNIGDNPGGDLVIQATESVEIASSVLSTTTFSDGAAGDIIIQTREFIVGETALIIATTEGNGPGGQIVVDASESVQIGDDGQFTQLATQSAPGATGSAGD